MKNMKRRLMSVVLALVLVCSMIPTGMAGESISLAPGSSKTVTAGFYGVYYQDAVWTSSNPEYVSVSGPSSGGQIPGSESYNWVRPTATIHVSENAPQGMYTINVVADVLANPFTGHEEMSDSFMVYVTGGATGNYVQISNTSMSMNVGDFGKTLTVSPISFYGASIDSVSWSSSNSSVAKVSSDFWNSTSATVTAVSSGKATITAYVQGTVNYYQSFTDTLTCTVTVNGGNVSLSRTALDLTTSPQDLTVYVNNGYLPSNYRVVWDSSRKDVATVSEGFGGTATVTPKSTGTTIVTATVYDVTMNRVGSASCNVTVNSGKVTLSATTLELTNSAKPLTAYVNNSTAYNYSVS